MTHLSVTHVTLLPEQLKTSEQCSRDITLSKASWQGNSLHFGSLIAVGRHKNRSASEPLDISSPALKELGHTSCRPLWTCSYSLTRCKVPDSKAGPLKRSPPSLVRTRQRSSPEYACIRNAPPALSSSHLNTVYFYCTLSQRRLAGIRCDTVTNYYLRWSHI
jgi:hypothetical protein